MTTTTTLSLDEFLTKAEVKPAREYEDGEVTRKAMPSKDHAWVQGMLGLIFGLYLRAHPGGFGGSELRCTFGPPGRRRSYVPDFVFIDGARTAGWRGRDPFRAAPDLAIEILSPADRMSRVMRKVRFCLENGVRQVWLIDPERRIVMVYTEPDVARVYTDDETLAGGDVLPDFSVAVRDLLPEPETAAGVGNGANANQPPARHRRSRANQSD